MLRPQIYPELAGRALMLDADPFVVMVDDDEPWAEGVFFITCIGVAVAIAQIVGGLLLSASLPTPNALLETLLQGWQQLGMSVGTAGDAAQVEASIRDAWGWATLALGYGAGWTRLFMLVTTPFGLIVQWLLYGLLGYSVARGMGGTGTVNQTLGATALMAAPWLLMLFTAIPLVSVSGVLLTTWALLIGYRALEVAHDLSWRSAMIAALAPWLILAGALLVAVLIFGAAIAL